MPKYDRETNLNAGLPEQDGIDDVAREAILARLAPRQTNLVGNLADLQRAGGLIATDQGSNLADGVELPGNVTAGDVKAQVKAEKAADKATGTTK